MADWFFEHQGKPVTETQKPWYLRFCTFPERGRCPKCGECTWSCEWFSIEHLTTFNKKEVIKWLTEQAHVDPKKGVVLGNCKQCGYGHWFLPLDFVPLSPPRQSYEQEAQAEVEALCM